jgi:hypothetical protein
MSSPLPAPGDRLRDQQVAEGVSDVGRNQQARASLHLQLRRSDAVPARRRIEALDEADDLTRAGTLLLPPFRPI